jgi:SAM-dependent methyltransferase
MTERKDAVSLFPDDIYRRRFKGMEQYRKGMWKILCRDFFQRYIPEQAIVVEVGAGFCEFINHIKAVRKMAVDINPDARMHADPDVEVLICPSTDMEGISDGSADVIFTSNFFEHLTKIEIVKTVKEFHRLLKPGGRVLILQPNIRYVYQDYWMFFDHVTPIDDRSLCELLEYSGFKIEKCISRFLPYTTHSRLPKSLWLIKIYLLCPPLWRFIGGQAFVYARK